MKKHLIKILLVVATCIMLLLIMTSCNILGNLLGNNDGGGSGSGGQNEPVTIVIHNATDVSHLDFYNTTTGKLKKPSTTPEKEGYVFIGWYHDEDCTEELKVGTKPEGGSTVHIYAKWDIATYTVVQIVDGVETTINVEHGSKANLTNPSKIGATFAGWYLDEDYELCYDEKTIVEMDLTIYAKWEYIQYNLTLVSNGGSVGSYKSTYTVNDEFSLPVASKTGTEFVGWYDNAEFNGEIVEEIKNVAKNVTLYARFLNNNATATAIDGKSEKEGDNFEIYLSYVAQTLDVTEYIDFPFNSEITITKSTAPDDVLDVQQVVVLANESETEIQSTVYTITVASEYYQLKGTGERKTYQLTVKQYSNQVIIVKYYVGEVLKSTENLFAGTTFESATYIAPSKNAYNFDCWTTEEDGEYVEYVFGNVVDLNAEIVLHAKYIPIEYEINYVLGLAENGANPTTYNIEDVILLADAVLDGYTFDSWYVDDDYTEKITKIENSYGELTLYARYSKNDLYEYDFSQNESGVYTVTEEEYPHLINYAVLNKMENLKVIVDGYGSADYDVHAISDMLYVPYSAYTIGIGVDTIEGVTRAEFNFDFSAEPSLQTNTGTYAQMKYNKWAKVGNRESDFDDFAINHVENALSVSNSESLYFALEQGYRPICVENSVAEEIYAEMKNILRSIISNDMTEKEKVVAIVEWIVTNIEYDNEVLNMYLSNPNNVNSYHSFYLEGSILDTVAVCDGISKALSALCGIEGILCYRVNGTNDKGVGHAWNKVYLDVDGDGTKEWSTIDATAVNSLLISNGVGYEIVNRKYLFTSDTFLLEQGYVYDDKWYEAGVLIDKTTETHNEYTDHTFVVEGDTYQFYIDTVDEYQAFGEYLLDLYGDLLVGEKMTVDICVKNTIAFDENDELNNPGVDGTFSYSKSDAENSGESIVIFILSR